MAQHWLELGAERLHIVDLNGAVAGVPKNELAIREIVSVIGEEIPLQLGGGIRDLDTIERYLDDGITYVIIGTAAVKNPGFLHDACYAFPGPHHRRPRRARRQGGDRRLVEDDRARRRRSRASKFEDYGVEAVVYTDIGRDGMLTGVNVEATVRLARELKIPVIASGGIASHRRHRGARQVRERRRHRRHRRPRALRGQARLQGGAEGGEGQVGRRDLAHPCSRSASFPASTSPRAASSRASISSTCAMPAIRSRSRAATTKQGADELAFLDIRASIETRGLLYDDDRGGRRPGVHSAHRRRRRQLGRRHPRAAQRGRRQGQHQHRRREESAADRGSGRRTTARNASSRRSTRSSRRRNRGRCSRTAGARRPASTRSNGRARSSPAAPARSC